MSSGEVSHALDQLPVRGVVPSVPPALRHRSFAFFEKVFTYIERISVGENGQAQVEDGAFESSEGNILWPQRAARSQQGEFRSDDCRYPWGAEGYQVGMRGLDLLWCPVSDAKGPHSAFGNFAGDGLYDRFAGSARRIGDINQVEIVRAQERKVGGDVGDDRFWRQPINAASSDGIPSLMADLCAEKEILSATAAFQPLANGSATVGFTTLAV
jgi:hypothetical protein